MNLQENIFRIKQMMGLLNEQEDTSSLTVQEKLKNGQKLTPEELNVKGDLALGFSKVKSLPEGLKVGGDLSLHYCENLTSLPNGLKVGGDLFLNDCDSLTSLPNGLEVGGHLFLIDAKINSLPKRLVVGGSLDLTGSAITSLPRGLKVGGLLKVDNTELIKYPNDKLLKMVGSNGYIKLGIFRNDSNYTANLEAPSNNHNNQELPWEKQTLSDTTQTTPLAQQTPTQTEKVIEVVTDSFTAKSCDELHAFQSTCPSKVFVGGKCDGGTKLVGDMHEKMRIKLDAIYQKGINPKVSNVAVSVNDMTVTWTCTIVESTDGKAWVGFTSRGAGCNDDIYARATSAVVHNDVDTIKDRINDMYKEPTIEIEEVNDFNYNGGGNSFRQIFYRYTKPKYYPPHKSKPITPNPITPITPGPNPVIPNPQPTTGTQTATTGGETPQNPQPATTEFKYPNMENPFTPTNGDPWKYAYDGTNLIVKSPTTGTEYNLLYPEAQYKTKYPGSKFKTQADLDKAIASIKTAYGDKLGMR